MVIGQIVAKAHRAAIREDRKRRMEGKMIRAKMSGENEFGTSNDYCRHIAGYGKATCTLQDYVLEGNLSRLAENEARAILAETEREDTISYSWAGIGTGRGPAAKMHDGFQHSPWVSLAESLAAFCAS